METLQGRASLENQELTMAEAKAMSSCSPKILLQIDPELIPHSHNVAQKPTHGDVKATPIYNKLTASWSEFTAKNTKETKKAPSRQGPSRRGRGGSPDGV